MKRKLGELLIEAGAASAGDVESALADQSAGEPSRLGDLLLSMGKITPAALARALAIQYGLPFCDLSHVAPEAIGLIPIAFQRAHKVVPFQVDRESGATRVHVALADPTQTDLVEELRSQLEHAVIVHVAPTDDIDNVHAALSGEGGGEPVLMGEVLEEDVSLSAEPAAAASQPDDPFAFAGPAPATDPFDFGSPPDPAGDPFAFAAPAPESTTGSVTEEELFGSMDLQTPAEVAPLSTALADEIGRHDLAPPQQETAGFAALSPPLGDPPNARASPATPIAEPVPLQAERPLTAPPLSPEPVLDAEVEPLVEADVIAEPAGVPSVDLPKIPSFAISPEVPVEPRRSPVEPLRRPAALGRIALKRVAVSKEGVVVDPAPAPKLGGPPLESTVALAVAAGPPELELPEWMRGPVVPVAAVPLLAAVEPGELSPNLVALLARVQSGDLQAGPVVASLVRLLIERRFLDDAAVIAELEKL